MAVCIHLDVACLFMESMVVHIDIIFKVLFCICGTKRGSVHSNQQNLMGVACMQVATIILYFHVYAKKGVNVYKNSYFLIIYACSGSEL